MLILAVLSRNYIRVSPGLQVHYILTTTHYKRILSIIITRCITDVYPLQNDEYPTPLTLQVVDGQPPVFQHCPSSTVLRGAPGGGQRVFWEEPEVVDNVEVTETRGPVRPSGSLFEAGTWNLSYTAKDGQGNVAWCNFTVTVTQIGNSRIRYPVVAMSGPYLRYFCEVTTVP